MTRYLGLDVGGANLKLADGGAFAASRYFPLWQRPADLAAELTQFLDEAPGGAGCGIAVTMTGELADCFETKREGVRHILAAVEEAASGRPILVYALPGLWLTAEQARQRTMEVAAANWHALAAAAAQVAGVSPAVVVDVGSTTCDVIPVIDGRVVALGRNDPKRLLHGELVYTGVRRSPVCAVAAELPWRGQKCPTAQELFATTLDAYLLTGDLPEDEQDCHTADGRPATRRWAHDRLARAICADRELFDEADALAAAQAIAENQQALLHTALRRVLARLEDSPTAVVSGSGEFLAARVCQAAGLPIVSLGQMLGPTVSSAAAAWAVAKSANER